MALAAILLSLSPALAATPTPPSGQLWGTPPVDTKAYPKLSSGLAQLAIATHAKGTASALILAPQLGVPVQGQNGVKVIVESDPAALAASVAAIKGVGATFESTYQNLIEAIVPLPALEQLSQSPGVTLVSQPMKPVPYVVSEGVNLISANTWQAAGLTGAGVKIGVLDVEFGDLQASINAGELPNIPQADTWWSPTYGQGAGVHGTACAEIIHDVAPNAQLYLATVGDEVELGNAVNWLISQGVNIISHSVGWYPSPHDGTGTVDSIVDTARAAGILWVNAAGNDAEQHWSGPWSDANGDNWLDFTPGVDWASVNANAYSTVDAYLTWTDPWGHSTNDYDLYLYRASDLINPVAYSADSQNGQLGTETPEEDLSYVVPYGQGGTYYLMVRRIPAASTSVSFDLFTPNQTLSPYQPSNSIGTPADSPNALAVGAVYWNTPTSIEYFSAQGPTRDGRTKPDLVGPDGVSTSIYSYGPGGFYGTSASAPHVAGAAALVEQAHPSYTPAQIQSFLEGRAVDLGSPGKDNVFGSGRLLLGPMADFHAGATSVSAGVPVTFFDDSIGSPSLWAWTFGDGATSTAQNPSHAYAQAGIYSVSLTATNGGGPSTMTRNSYITVTSAVLDHITVSPSAASVPSGGNQSYSATGYDASGNVISGLTFTWSVSNPAAGSINPSTGIFTAGDTLGAYTNVVQATYGAVTGTASVTVTVYHITISPANPLVGVNSSQAFSAQGYDALNNPINGLTYRWSLTRPAAGSIDASTGMFTAGTNAGAFRAVQATVGGVSGDASVTVTPGPLDHIRVVTAHPDVVVSTQQSFSAIGYDQYNNIISGFPLTWSVPNGSVGLIAATTGVFTASAIVQDAIDAIHASSPGVSDGIASVNVIASGNAVVNGAVTLQGAGRPVSGRMIPLTVKVFPAGTSDANLLSGATALVVFGPPSAPIAEDSGSNTVIFQITLDAAYVPGNYDITIGSTHTLLNVKKNVMVAAGANSFDFGVLLEGNCNNDGQVNTLDFSAMVASYLKGTGQVGFNANADFDNNGVVNAADFSLLAANYLDQSPITVP